MSAHNDYASDVKYGGQIHNTKRIYTAHTAVVAVTLVGTKDILLTIEISIISKSLESVKLEKASIVFFLSFRSIYLFITHH